MNECTTLQVEQPPVVVDSRNIAGSAKQSLGIFDYDRVFLVCKYHIEAGSRVTAVIPFWEKELKVKLKSIGVEIFTFRAEKDKEIDDKMILGQAGIVDGYIVTNDTSMSKFLTRGLLDRDWFNKSRIGFKFEGDQYIPIFPSSWENEVGSIQSS